ncbi:MAG: 2-keto-4-pentenoate hydratase [Burkholderiales bacterium]|nr:2-keto-4-pentenoate hydratase [Burkholderiales bacterium]
MSLSSEAIQNGARELARRRRDGLHGPALDAACRPQSLADALAIQAAVSDHLGDEVGGWKCGLPSEDRIVVAPIYQRTIHTSTACPVWAAQGAVRVEPELAFLFGRDLPLSDRPFEVADLAAAVSTVRLALELIDSRYDEGAELTFADRLADGLVNQGLWLGPELPWAEACGASSFDVQWGVVDQPAVTLPGRHPSDNPVAPLLWLANHFRQSGRQIRAGQAVITGSYAGTFACPVGPDLSFRYGVWTPFSLRFHARSC